MNKQEGQHERIRRLPVKKQRRRHETQARFVTGHVAHAKDVDEQVGNDKTSIPGGNEAADHSTGHE
jgi:hypothetical protein